MLAKVLSAAILGLDANLVEVEVDVSHGLRSFSIVGLPDKVVEESKERIGSAIKSSRLLSPRQRTLKILVNLAPADLKKEGSLYDLPIALAFLIASKQAKPFSADKLFLGELSLDGRLRPIRGALSFALLCKREGIKEIVLPAANTLEAALVREVNVIGVETLAQTLAYLEGRTVKAPLPDTPSAARDFHQDIDINWIKGQEYAKRALEITAAGAHNLFLSGPPGGGKSLLAKSLPSILPRLTNEESLEVTKIYSVAGMTHGQGLIQRPPFRSPHHIASDVALLGGGNPPRPGEITLAHRGVLFLDEFPEFHRDVLESLRQPIEDGSITISRAKLAVTFPSRFMLVGASNPCPCGFLTSHDRPCTCSPSQVAMYRRKLSGPLMDRIDILIEVPAIRYDKLASNEHSDENNKMRGRIMGARDIQRKRLEEDRILTNAEMGIPHIKKHCAYDGKSGALLKRCVDSGRLSARGFHRTLKVARTIADLAQSPAIQYDHIAEALMYKMKG